MARPSATAALLPLLLVLSLLAAVAHCRTVAVHAADPESTAAAVAVGDENGLSSSSSIPILPAEAAAASATTDEEEILPAEQQQHDHEFEFLRLPSSHRLHRRHRPCSLHRNLWWKRHHGVGFSRDAPRRFQLHDHYSGHGERRDAAVSHLAVLPAEEARGAEEVKPVAEPDPDRSLPVDSDVEGEPSSFADADGHDGGESAAAVSRAWKKEMLRRWFHFHRLHHVHHHHHEEEEQEAPDGMNMKRFLHFHHHHDGEEDEEKNVMGKRRLRHAEAEHGEDSDDEDEDEEVEEMVRRFRKAIMRRKRFGHGHGHGRRFFHHHDHSHRHAEEAENNQQADGEEEESGGVMAWIKGLMNRF